MKIDGETFLIAFEVKDKPVFDSHVRSSVEKTVKDHALRNLAFVAVSKDQEVRNFDDVIRWAATHGVKITVFLDWAGLYRTCKCFAHQTDDVYEGKVFRQLLARAADLGVSRASLESLRTIAGVPSSANGG